MHWPDPSLKYMVVNWFRCNSLSKSVISCLPSLLTCDSTCTCIHPETLSVKPVLCSEHECEQKYHQYQCYCLKYQENKIRNSGVYAYSVSLQAKCWTGNDLCLEFHILQIHFKKIIIYIINTNNKFGV